MLEFRDDTIQIVSRCDHLFEIHHLVDRDRTACRHEGTGRSAPLAVDGNAEHYIRVGIDIIHTRLEWCLM